ncbi:Bacterial leucyl aminopeptidase precursor [Anatilimnocola aggregata]|uniref:Bacterial leucyl aminopeptidase n=1 Tax=Anatilimnocola aggregata TaxID=2528021 RepID=A0A517YM36_9BACT|nr:M20/M25/M40 family metallo-hydrolase [Anatilimnocola aggregata]QDU31281.1 Bacterial leucyl aminopeptidase precursor [Anatilimnocola aggregata]
MINTAWFSRRLIAAKFNRSLLAVALASVSLTIAASAAEKANVAAESQARLKETVGYLSSDELEGRGVGTEGLNKAADYLAAEFRKLGLKTDLFDGTPFQKFEVTVTTEMGPAKQNFLSLVGPLAPGAKEPEKVVFKLGEDFNPLAAGGTGAFDADLVFAGYGITSAKDPEYDDYKDLKVEGKVVVLLRKEPQQQDPKSKFNGDKPSPHAIFMRKIGNAYEHGAAAVIFINDGLELKTAREVAQKVWTDAVAKLAEERTKFGEIKEPTADQQEAYTASIKKLAERIVELSNDLANPDQVLTFTGAGDEIQQRKMPVLFAKRSLIEPIVKSVTGKSLAEIEAGIDADLKPQSAVLTGWKAIGEANVVQKKTEVKNVIAVLEGEGPHADETIVIGAHYDHLGLGGAGSLAPWTKEIHNGADDNASGTALLLEVAHQLATSGKKPQRRIVFMAFTGEERGLLGSAHYTRQPRFPLDKTVAMFNLDMVGRLTDDKLIVYGTGTAKEFDPLVESLAKKYDFKLTKKPEGYGPSDHSSFYAKKIPVLHLFTGTHSDYHRPSDDSPKLNIEGMQRIAAMLVDVVNDTDALSTRPEYIEIKGMAMIGGAGDSDRPYFGSIPDFANNEEGVLLSGVAPGGPAEKGGLKGGDLIIKIGDSKIGSLEDMQSALVKHKIGEKVKVIVKRDGKEQTFDVTLTKRGR